MSGQDNVAQVGGTHYEAEGLQHWDYVEDMGLGYLEGCATKYLCRAGTKTPNPRLDYQKTRGYILKLLALFTAEKRENRCLYAYGKRNPPWAAADLQRAYKLDDTRTMLIEVLTVWTSQKHLLRALALADKLIEESTDGS